MVERDLALLCGARNLDPDAIIKIFDQYSPTLYSYTLCLCNDPLLAGQIVGTKVNPVKVIQNQVIAVLRRILHGQLAGTADSPPF